MAPGIVQGHEEPPLVRRDGPRTGPPRFRFGPQPVRQLRLPDPAAPDAPAGTDPAELGRRFCDTSPHRGDPFTRRNWGGALHSLCSYQGKLKPAIAHFLVSWFTEPGWRVLDPLAGVGTIPLEARRLGRVGVANDLSPLAACVSRAKLEPFGPNDVAQILDRLARHIAAGPDLAALESSVDLGFGLNGTIRHY